MAGIFPDEFVPSIEGSSYYSKWVKANPGEAAKWSAFRDAAKAYSKDGSLTAPSMGTKYGKALVAAGKLHMSVIDLGAVYKPPPTEPPPLELVELWHRYLVSDWSSSDEITAGSITNTTSIPQPSGSPTSNWIRYYLIDGTTADRCECANTGAGAVPHFFEGDNILFRWWHRLEQLPIGSDWNIVFQAHLPGPLDNQPTVIVNYGALERKLMLKTSTGGGHTVRYTAPSPMPLNTTIKIELQVKWSKDTANGFVKLTLDDVIVLPETPAATLGTNTNSTWDQVYIKQGLYRSPSITGNAITYNNGLQAWRVG